MEKGDWPQKPVPLIKKAKEETQNRLVKKELLVFPKVYRKILARKFLFSKLLDSGLKKDSMTSVLMGL